MPFNDKCKGRTAAFCEDLVSIASVTSRSEWRVNQGHRVQLMKYLITRAKVHKRHKSLSSDHSGKIKLKPLIGRVSQARVEE